MKKFLILFFVLGCSYTAKAQNYRPLQTFGTDTIAYMRYNFVDRKAKYIDKPLANILADYELELILSPRETYEYAPGANGKAWIFGALIQYTDYYDRDEPYGRINIYFKTPHLPWRETFDSMEDTDDDWEWVSVLQDCIVEDIKLVIGPFGPKK